MNGLPVKGLSRKGSRGISAPNPRILGVEVEDKVEITISIDIFSVSSSMSFSSPMRSKLDAQGIDGGGVKSVGSQNGDWDHSLTLGINAVEEATRFDVDGNFDEG